MSMESTVDWALLAHAVQYDEIFPLGKLIQT